MFSKLKRKISKKYIVKEDKTAKHLVLKKTLVALGIATFLSSIVFFVSKSVILSNANAQFSNDTMDLYNGFNIELDRYKDLTYNLKSFIENNDNLNQTNFNHYVLSLHKNNYSQLYNVNYIESVNQNNLSHYYAQLAKEYNDVHLKEKILQKMEDQNLSNLIEGQYFVVSYSEPMLEDNWLGQAMKISNGEGKIGVDEIQISQELVNHAISDKTLKTKSHDYILYMKMNINNEIDKVEKYRGLISLGLKINKNLITKALETNKYLHYQIRENNQGKITIIDQDQSVGEKPLFSKIYKLTSLGNNLELYAYTLAIPPNLAEERHAYLIACGAFLLMILFLAKVMKIYEEEQTAFTIAKKMTEELRVAAYADNLTGLPNRQSFLEELNSSIESYPEEEIYILFLDLDGFKKVNDTLGHAAGDVILSNFAARLKKLAKSEPIKCYRIGGDEFIISLETRDSPLTFKRADIEDLAKNLLLLTKQSFSVSGEEFFLSVSIGIAQYPLDGKTTKELFKNSDLAMYETKKKGKNNYVFYSEQLHTSLDNKNGIGNALLNAFEKDEFYLVYQPKLKKNGLEYMPNGAEVLLRWNNDELGEMSPAQFLNIAEEMGLMPKIGLWVFEQSVKKIAQWKSEGLEDIVLAINLSFLQFEDINLNTLFINILDQYKVGTDQIIIEVTESTMMQDIDTDRGLLLQLSQSGFKISIDDFGTGYSSLSYLRRYPFDEIKIDRSFTTDMLLNSKDRIFLSAIIELAHNLNVNVVIEGVENKEQLEWFDKQGSVEVQGYYFSKPLKEDLFLEYWISNKKKQLDNNYVDILDINI